MTLWQALRYFFAEAAVSAARNARASAVAVLTCALSLYIGGFFLLAGGNLARKTASWQEAVKINVYLENDPSEATIERIRSMVEQPAWITGAVLVDREEAASRFQAAFPSVASALGQIEELDLPASIEATLLPGALDTEEWLAWTERLAAEEAVASVDDDREWIRDLRQASFWVRSAGLGLGLALLVAAAFTIAAVVRLTAYQYLDEIAVLRLVGATEFYVRGPFIVEGFLQGLTGATLAVLGLLLTRAVALFQGGEALWAELLFERFLPPSTVTAVIAVGALAGLAGSVLSIRRESLEILEED